MTTPNYPASPTSSGATGGTGSTTTDSGVKDQAQQTAGTAADEGQRVASVAADEARRVAGEAKQQAQSLMGDARNELSEQSRSQRDRLVATLQEFSTQLDGMASGEGAPSGLAQDAVRQVADRVRGFSSHLDGREPTDLLEDVRSLARRRPGTFLLGAMAAGLVAGRLSRGAKDARSDGSYDEAGFPAEPAYDGTAGTAGTASNYPVAGTGHLPEGSAAPLTEPNVAFTSGAATEPDGSPWTPDTNSRGGL